MSVPVTNARVILDGHEIDFDAAVNLMDDDIREKLHAKLAPCSAQKFINAYAIAHRKKYGKDFQIN